MSAEARNLAVRAEEISNWGNIFAFNSFLLYIVISLELSTLWMIIVSANMPMYFLTICLASHFLIRFVGGVIASKLNGSSERAKSLIIVGQIFGLIGGVMMIYAANNY